MKPPQVELPQILHDSPVRVVFGAGTVSQLGAFAAQDNAKGVLLVTDPGIVAAGHVARAENSLREAGLTVTIFDGVGENPTTNHIEAGLVAAKNSTIDVIIGFGGGSSMDCAKGINILLTNGGRIADYWGINKTTKPMLPMIAVPTTAGTGSEAQSFALVSDPVTHEKMACGDRRLPANGGLRPRVAILDPELTITQPRAVTAATGIDAIAHAVETAGTKPRSDVSLAFTREAWRLLCSAYPKVVVNSNDLTARADMLLGAHLAGAAIEHSMLGAAHACANPLTARCGLVHGIAVGLMLPHVVRFNSSNGVNPYAALALDAHALVDVLESFLREASLPMRLRDCDVPPDMLSDLAVSAASQWTATFNPIEVGPQDFEEIYQAAL